MGTKMIDVFEYDHATGKTKQRKFTAEELAQLELDQAQALEFANQEQARITAKQAALAKLGLTEEELKAILN